MDTKQSILLHTTRILAQEGSAGTSMRKVASAVGIEPSVIYNHFADKETLLRSTRVYITSTLDAAIKQTVNGDTAHELLRSSLRFQLEHREIIVALLQYFMAARNDFPSTEYGYVPARAYQHTVDVIQIGIDEGVYHTDNIMFDAKLITHMINGFLMEYFDREMSADELDDLVERLTDFIENALSVKKLERKI